MAANGRTPGGEAEQLAANGRTPGGEAEQLAANGRTPGGEAEEVAPLCSCITCGDVAEPMRVLRIDADRELALCEDDAGGHRTVEIALVAPVTEGDQLLVHAGTAIA